MTVEPDEAETPEETPDTFEPGSESRWAMLLFAALLLVGAIATWGLGLAGGISAVSETVPGADKG